MYIPADIVNNVLLGSLNSGKRHVLFSRCLIVKLLILFNRPSPFLSGLLQFFTFTFFFTFHYCIELHHEIISSWLNSRLHTKNRWNLNSELWKQTQVTCQFELNAGKYSNCGSHQWLTKYQKPVIISPWFKPGWNDRFICFLFTRMLKKLWKKWKVSIVSSANVYLWFLLLRLPCFLPFLFMDQSL